MVAPTLVRAIAKIFRIGSAGERFYFDEGYYRATYADIANTGIDPFGHFMRHGWQEGRNPSAAFSLLFYRDRYFVSRQTNPLTHYVAAGGRSSRLETQPASSGEYIKLQRSVICDLFDAAYYAVQAGSFDEDPITHYLAIGWKQGYSPNPSFDPSLYCKQFEYVKALGVSPFYHYASQKRLLSEDRKPTPVFAPPKSRKEVEALVSTEFDASYYRSKYTDVRRAGLDPLAHYIDHGWRERRNPTPLFNTSFYLASNDDVAASNINPFYHYLKTGRAEGRAPNPVGPRLYPKLAAPKPADWSRVTPAADVGNAEYIVIIPVYRGYDETLATIHAVLAAPQTTRFGLHVVNDASPDAALQATLGDLAARGLFSLEKNETNLGFVKTCNRGLRGFTDKAVVLLNADATVFGDWLDRIDAHAKSDPRIATITPLSNNATICSYPTDNDNNVVELECAPVELDRLAADCNAGRTSDLPTGVGFCLYMSRASREAIGLFDEITFGRGYGEESDFCFRAAKAGFRNVLAQDVFVYHAGQVSFAATEYEPSQAALTTKHPDYIGRIKQHLRADPGETGRMRLDLKRLARFAGPNTIVFVSHAVGGGIRTHTKHMEARLRAEGVTVIHLRVGVSNRWSVQIALDEPGGPFCPNLRPASFRQIRSLVADFLAWLSPRAIHIHSLVGFDWGTTTELFDLVQSSGVPYYFTLHDYSVVCHRDDLVLANGRYCGLPEIEACRMCVDGDRSYPEAIDPLVRRQTYDRFLRTAAAVFAPSTDIQERLQKAGVNYPIVVRPHEEARSPSAPESRGGTARDVRGPERPLRVAIVGAIGTHKGSHIVMDLARDAANRGLPIRFHIIGDSDLTEELKGLGVIESGRYKNDDDAVALITALWPDCIFLPSIWPETYCYTLSLAFRLKIPPVVFDVGAQRDRVRASGFGIVLPYSLIDDPRSLNERLMNLPLVDPASLGNIPETYYRDIIVDYYRLPSNALPQFDAGSDQAETRASSVR